MNKKNDNSKWVWVPRGVAFFYIAFLLMFALDTFSTPKTIWQQLGEFLIHGIPSWILILTLILTWNKHFLAGISFIVLAVVIMFFFATYEHFSGFMVITLPPVLIGLSFIIYDKMIKDK